MKKSLIRNKKHLAFVRSFPCLIQSNGEHCNGTPVVAHHLTHVIEKGGIGIKTGDNWTVPLCHAHHHGLHMIGEKSFWKTWDIDSIEEARKLWKKNQQ